MIKVCKQHRTILFWKSITQTLLSDISKWLQTNAIFFWYLSGKKKKVLYLEKLAVIMNFYSSGFGFLNNEQILAPMLWWLDKPWHPEPQHSSKVTFSKDNSHECQKMSTRDINIKHFMTIVPVLRLFPSPVCNAARQICCQLLWKVHLNFYMEAKLS